MLKFGNKEFRNLQEQVLKNMQNIANLKEGTAVLSEFGIKVVGEVDSLQDLPSVIDYKTAHDDWEYGDAFAIGTQPPYTLVILTRANDEITADHWFDIGDFPAPGPQGAQGPQGDVGPQGQTGDTGPAGDDAGFGSVLATAQTLPAGSSATATVTASGPNTAKEFSFTFGIPRGADGSNAAWGNIQGDLEDQTDLQDALDAKQDTLVSGTNIKTINNQSVVGSGNIEINSGVWGNITGTLSDQTDLANALAEKQPVIDASHKLSASYVSGLADVATTGAYSDLSGKPTIGEGTITIKKNGDTIDSFGVNQTADQNINITVPTKTSDLSNDSNFTSKTYVDDGLALKQDVISDLSDIRSGAAAGATALQPAAISDMATETWVGQQGYLTSVSWSEVSDKPAFATVATSGDYDDLTNKPTIPAAQVNSDWNASSGVAQILNKPTNLVTTNTAQTITGQKSFSNASFSTRPSFANGLQFDYGISHEITVKESGSGSSGTYNFDFPAKSGTLALTSDIPTTMAWNNVTGKPTFATVATSGSYNDLSNKPTIPTNNNQLTNGAGYQTASDVSTAISTATTNMVTTNTAQTISGYKTFTNNSGIKLENSSNGDINTATLSLGQLQSGLKCLLINARDGIGSTGYNGSLGILPEQETNLGGLTLLPVTTGTVKDIGRQSTPWRDIWISGKIIDPSGVGIAVANIANKSNIPSGTVLWSRTPDAGLGTTGLTTITLSDDITNYDYIEVSFNDNDSIDNKLTFRFDKIAVNNNIILYLTRAFNSTPTRVYTKWSQ